METGPTPHYVYCRRQQDPTVMTISQCKWQSPGIARRRTVSPTSHTLRKCPRNNPIWGWRARDTQESVKLTKWSPRIRAKCRTVKYKTQTGAPMAPGKMAETNQVRCKAIEVEPPQLPKVPHRTKRKGRRPPQSETRTNDGNRQERHGARGATMQRDLITRPTQRNGGGHAQDIARERQQSLPQKRTRPPPRRCEGRNEWATPTGPPTEEQTREKVTAPGRGRTKQRGKNSCRLAATGRVTASAPAAPGHQENQQEETEASPEGESLQA